MPEQLARFISFVAVATAAAALAVNVASSTFTGAIAAHPLRQLGRETPQAEGPGHPPAGPHPLCRKGAPPSGASSSWPARLFPALSCQIAYSGQYIPVKGMHKEAQWHSFVILKRRGGGMSGGVAGERRKRRKSNVYRNSFPPMVICIKLD